MGGASDKIEMVPLIQIREPWMNGADYLERRLRLTSTNAALFLLVEPMMETEEGELCRLWIATWAIHGSHPDCSGDPQREVQALAGELQLFLSGALARINADSRNTGELTAAETESGPGLWLDAVGADILEEIGPSGEKVARRMREASAMRWEAVAELEPSERKAHLPRLLTAWLNPEDPVFQSPWVANVARALWLDRVKKREEMKREEMKREEMKRATPPALSMLDCRHLLEPIRAPASVRGSNLISADGRILEEIHPPAWKNIAVADMEMLARFRDRGFLRLPSVHGVRAFAWLVHRAWEAYWQRPTSEAHAPLWWVIEGGWGEVAADIYRANGLRPPSDLRSRGRDFRDILSALAHRRAESRWAESSSLLMIDTIRRPHRGQSPLTRFTASASLAPYEVKNARRVTKSDRTEGRLLFPVLLPPPVGAERHHHAQALLGLDLLAEMVRQSREIVKRGGLPDPGWTIRTRLASEVGLGSLQVRQLWRAWKREGFVAEDEPGLVRLGDEHASEWSHILRQGERRETNAERARRGAAKRRQKRGPK